MSETFTPRPWKRHDTEDYAEIHPKVNGSPIALVGRGEDADLIAAAPDLYAALQAIVDCADPEGIGTFDGAYGLAANRLTDGRLVLKGHFIACCSKAASALAKARGDA